MKIQLKRSVVLEDYGQGNEAKRPEAVQMLDGELAVNYNANDPAIFLKDSAGAIIRIAGNNSIGGDQTLTYEAKGNAAGELSISDGNTVYIPIATNTVAGLFTGDEKQKLAGISASAGVDQNLGYTPNNDLAGTVTIDRGTSATIPIATNSVAGLFTGAEKQKLAGLNTDAENDTRFVQVAGDTMTGTLTINNDTDDENALVTGAGHDIVLGAGANIVFDNANDTTVQANTLAGADVIATLPATSGTLTTEPTADGVYLRKLDGTTLTWVSVSDDTDGVITEVSAGDGIDVDVTTDPNVPVISVDLAANQGLEIQSTELAVIAGTSAQDTLLWTVTGGAAAIVNAGNGASGATTEPEGRYVGVATSATAGSGCTVNFDVANDGTISNLTIANPGSGYGQSEVLTIVGHQTAAPADITFTLQTDADGGRYDFTGWRTGALATGTLIGVDGGPGIQIEDSGTTSPKVSIDLASTSGLGFSANTDAGELQVNAGPGIEVVAAGVSTRIHTGGGLSNQLGTGNNELGLADPTTPGTSNQVVVWKATNSAQTIALAADPNHVSTAVEADYINVPTTLVTTDPSATGSGLTVNFTVGASGAITNLTISNPGSNYSEATPVCSVDNHGLLRVNISAKYADAQWVVEPFSGGGGGGGGGDVTGVDAGDGIDVSTGGGPEPVVSVDVHADGGLTTRFDGTVAANEGELGLVAGVNTDDVMVWRAADSVIALDTIAATGSLAIGDYTNVATTGGGTGLTVAFSITVADVAPASITVINPGTGYSDGDLIRITGFNLTCNVDGVNVNARWQPGVDKNTTYDLSNTLIADGSRVDLSGSDNTLDSISIVGSGDTTVAHTNGTITISSTNTTDTNTTYDLSNTSVAGGSQIDLTDSDSNVDSVSITGSTTLSVTHSSGTIGLSTIVGNGLSQSNDGLTVTASNGIEVGASGVSTNIYGDGGLSDTLGTGNSQLGLAPPADVNTSNQTYVWKAAGSVQGLPTINGTSDQAEGEYLNVGTTAVLPSVGSDLVVNFELDDSGNVSDLSIVNPGQDYATGNVVNVDGHAGFTLIIGTIYSDARWLAEAFSGGSGGGGGSGVLAVTGGDGISVDSSVTTSPEVSINELTNGGIAYSSGAAYIDLGASAISGTVAISHGGTGLSTTPAAGQLLIGNATNSDYDLANLTEGTGISITDGDGSIAIACTSGGDTTGDLGFWTRSNTDPNVLSPVNAGDNISTSGTITSGTLNLNQNAQIIFEGATDDTNETTLTVTDPTAGRTITLPDDTGIVTLDPGHGARDSVINYVRQVTTNSAGTGVQSVTWVADAGGDLTGLSAGNGIAIANENGPIPTVSVAADANGGITNNFNSGTNVGLTPGSNAGDIMVWRGAGAVVALDNANVSGSLPSNGTYTDIQTTSLNGTGLTVSFTIAGALPDPITVINPGSGYSDGDSVTINGTDLSCTVDGVIAAESWRPGTLTSSVDVDGSAGHWTRDDATDTLSPVLDDDNVDIGTGTFTGRTLALETNNSTNTVSHEAVDSLGSSVTYTWPAVGTAGQVLSTDTSGNLSWTNHVLVQDGSSNAPNVANYSQGQLWWNSDENVSKLFVLYNDPQDGEGTTEPGGLKWIEASPKPRIPSIFPDLGDNTPQTGTLDDRYLRVDALPVGQNNQTVASTGITTFNGLVDGSSGLRASGGADNTVQCGMYGNSNQLRLVSDSDRQLTFLDNVCVRHYPDAANSVGFQILGEFTGAKTSLIGVSSYIQSSTFDIPDITHYTATQDASVNCGTIKGFEAAGPLGLATTAGYGFYSELSLVNGVDNFNYYASGNASNFFQGSVYIGGTATRNTRKLWESTLTEEQEEQLTAGTLAIPANVSTPGDGSFVRQWWYDQQSAEDQLLIDSGELEYPKHFQAANFVDTFNVGVTTNINLLSNGRGEFGGGVRVTGGDSNSVVNGIVYSSGREVNVIADSSRIVRLNSSDGYKISFNPEVTGGGGKTYGYGIVFSPTITGEFTTEINLMRTQPTLTGAITPVLNYFSATNITTAPTGIQSVRGYLVEGSIAFGAVSNYGFVGGLATDGNKNFNFFASGNAPNYFRGATRIGGAADGGFNPGYNNTDVGFVAATFADITKGGILYISREDGVCSSFNTNTVGNLMEFRSGGTQAGYLSVTADTGVLLTSNSATGPVIVQNSDARVKTLTPFTGSAADVVSQLSPGVNGFIAHELQAHVSDAVTGTQDETEAIGTLADYDGTVLETEVTEPDDLTYTEDVTDSEGVTTQAIRTRTWTGTGTRPVYQGVDQTKLIPLLTKALQEALDKIEVLEQRLSDAGIA